MPRFLGVKVANDIIAPDFVAEADKERGDVAASIGKDANYTAPRAEELQLAINLRFLFLAIGGNKEVEANGNFD